MLSETQKTEAAQLYSDLVSGLLTKVPQGATLADAHAELIERFAALLGKTRKDERERCVMTLNELSKMRRIDFQNAIEEAVDSIRALKVE